MATTAAIATAIYPKKSWFRSYVRLNDFSRSRYIRSVASDSGKAFVWTLDNKGYAVIEKSLPKLFSTGFKSENQFHDFLVTAIHLGEWLSCTPKGCATFSEQELRRIHQDCYPKWVPITDTHRPDGYWKVVEGGNGQSKVIALEVELSLKSPSEYRELGEFYGPHNGAAQVLWVTKSESSAKYILKHLVSGFDGDNNIHSFVSLDQYYETQWQSKIMVGKDQGTTIANLLGNIGESPTKDLSAMFCLDGRKSPLISTTKEHIRKHDFGGSRRYMDHEIYRLRKMKKYFLVLGLLGLCGCMTMKSNKQNDTNKSNKDESKAPFLTSPKVRKVWIPEKIENDKFIEGHWMWVLERTSTWSQ